MVITTVKYIQRQVYGKLEKPNIKNIQKFASNEIVASKTQLVRCLLPSFNWNWQIKKIYICSFKKHHQCAETTESKFPIKLSVCLFSLHFLSLRDSEQLCTHKIAGHSIKIWSIIKLALPFYLAQRFVFCVFLFSVFLFVCAWQSCCSYRPLLK